MVCVKRRREAAWNSTAAFKPRIHHHTFRRITHTLPALLAPLPALPLRHRTPCDARQGRRCELAHRLDAIDRPSTRRQHRAYRHRRSSSSSRNSVLVCSIQCRIPMRDPQQFVRDCCAPSVAGRPRPGVTHRRQAWSPRSFLTQPGRLEGIKPRMMQGWAWRIL